MPSAAESLRELQHLLTHLRRELDLTRPWVEDWQGVRIANPALTALTLEELAVIEDIRALQDHVQPAHDLPARASVT